MPAREHLMFTLWAPLAAMGEIAVGERRTGANRPAKSAILGLLAAALGIERSAEADLAALAAGYGLAVRVDLPGSILFDYHTAQVPAARKGRRWATRRAELREPTLGTILSKREYRQGPQYTIALWVQSEAAPHSLSDLREALQRPKFTLYLGRKACPLGLPPAPRLVMAESLSDAFAGFDATLSGEERRLHERLGQGGRPGEVYAEATEWTRLGTGLRAERVERRRDLPLSRRRWQFGLREEVVASPVQTEPSHD